MEREGDEMRRDVGRKARERLRRKFRSEHLAMGLLVGRESTGRGDLAQVRGVAALDDVAHVAAEAK